MVERTVGFGCILPLRLREKAGRDLEFLPWAAQSLASELWGSDPL
jgi:hypothetical protein